jgi:hypothetical protein
VTVNFHLLPTGDHPATCVEQTACALAAGDGAEPLPLPLGWVAGVLPPLFPPHAANSSSRISAIAARWLPYPQKTTFRVLIETSIVFSSPGSPSVTVPAASQMALQLAAVTWISASQPRGYA